MLGRQTTSVLTCRYRLELCLRALRPFLSTTPPATCHAASSK